MIVPFFSEIGEGACKDGRERYYDYVQFSDPTNCKKRGQELQLPGFVGVEIDTLFGDCYILLEDGYDVSLTGDH